MSRARTPRDASFTPEPSACPANCDCPQCQGFRERLAGLAATQAALAEKRKASGAKNRGGRK